MKFFPILIFLLGMICSSSCEDSILNPEYFLECDIDGQSFSAKTNKDAWLSWFNKVGGAYTVIGQKEVQDKSINLDLFGELGEAKIQVGTNVNSYLTNIALFDKDKDYYGTESGGSGYVNVTLLTDDHCEGTFEAVLINSKDPSDSRKITNGKFKVKTR